MRDLRNHPTIRAAIHRLLGCEWGTAIRTADDPHTCPRDAVRRTVLHGLPDQQPRIIQLCNLHDARVQAETNPHKIGNS